VLLYNFTKIILA